MKYYIIAIVIVVAAGAIIGITMASKRNAEVVTPPPPPATQVNPPVSNSNAAPTPASTTTKPVANRTKLTITIPGQNATQKELDEYSAKVVAQAVATTKVDISGCIPDPVVARFTKAQSLTFVNPDDKPYTVFYKKDTSVVVPPKSEKQIKIDMPGIYGYSCPEQTISGTAGLLMVTSE